jgi:hypothetical protein
MTLTTHLHFQSPLYLHGIGTASTLHLPLQQLHFMLLTSLTTFWMGETKENKKKNTIKNKHYSEIAAITAGCR